MPSPPLASGLRLETFQRLRYFKGVPLLSLCQKCQNQKVDCNHFAGCFDPVMIE